jgi:hypothetical protein
MNILRYVLMVATLVALVAFTHDVIEQQHWRDRAPLSGSDLCC